MSIEMLQAQIDFINQEIENLKEQNRELREAAEKCKPAEPAPLFNELQELRAWKESTLAVDRQWDPQALAAMLGARPGDNVRAVIQREVSKLVERVKQLEGSNMLQLPWDKAPEWAQWAAMDEDTNWYWHSQEPHPFSDTEWISYHSVQDFTFPPCTNWKESKRKRP